MFVTDVFSKIKWVVGSKRRGLIAILIFLSISSVAFTLPWFYQIQKGVGEGMGASGPGPNSGTMLDLKTPPENTMAYFDTEKGM
ncbi:hypothetical protein KEJ18_05640 [Candidatus Bathyarchaeota archaeon]|nr:hypothetical protein [Candidatus Bathyarchaeota archaeon]